MALQILRWALIHPTCSERENLGLGNFRINSISIVDFDTYQVFLIRNAAVIALVP